jgi:N-acetylneuraminic acid mutarotase
MSQGSYTVTVSAPGYVPQVFAATIVAGQTTSQDVVLRLDAPCTSPPAEALDVAVPQGGMASETLVMANSGAGELSFTLLESPFDLAPVVGPAGSPVPSSSFQLGTQTGPASILSLAGRATGSESEASPLSGWFGGVDLPGGIVRYAHAQCAEQPDSFYIFGGVDGSFGISSRAWRYDAAANTWTQLADVPAGSEAPVATCFAGKIYVLGGGGTDQFYIYDVVSDSWTAGAPLPRGVEGAAAAAWDGKVYLVGGDDDFAPSTGVSDQVDVYDIATGIWIGTAAPMPAATSNAGFVQVGPHLYVAGGWNELSPDANVSSVQRYDLEADAWQIGPEFASARADLALAATVQALYAIGGDKDGNSFFDASSTVERLDLSAWPGGAWSDLADPLPVALVANNAGFCTLALFDGQVAETWSVGGLDAAWYIGGRALFREAPGEKCYSIYADVPWLSVTPAAGEVPPGGSLPIIVTFDASALSPGSYTATLIVQTDDTGNYLIHIPVNLTVVSTRLYYLPVISKSSGP